jgi:hypothetical protein
VIAVRHSVESHVSFEFLTMEFFAQRYLKPETVVVAPTFEHATPLLIFAAAAGETLIPPEINAAESTAIKSLRAMTNLH